MSSSEVQGWIFGVWLLGILVGIFLTHLYCYSKDYGEHWWKRKDGSPFWLGFSNAPTLVILWPVSFPGLYLLHLLEKLVLAWSGKAEKSLRKIRDRLGIPNDPEDK